MDKRRKPLTAYEQLELREKLDALIAEHPEYSVPHMLRQARTLLRLTLEEMAQLVSRHYGAHAQEDRGWNQQSHFAHDRTTAAPVGTQARHRQADSHR
jgi:hypothetical protein